MVVKFQNFHGTNIRCLCFFLTRPLIVNFWCRSQTWKNKLRSNGQGCVIKECTEKNTRVTMGQNYDNNEEHLVRPPATTSSKQNKYSINNTLSSTRRPLSTGMFSAIKNVTLEPMTSCLAGRRATRSATNCAMVTSLSFY